MPLRTALPNTTRVRRTTSVVVSSLARARLSQLKAGLGREPDRRIRLGVDIRPFYEPLTGVGWYLYHLLVELAKRDDFEIIAFGEAIDDIPMHVVLPRSIRHVAFPSAEGELDRRMLSAAFPLLIRAQKCDLFFGANYFLPRALAAVAKRRVVTVHDLTYRRYPELLQQETLQNLEREMLREIVRADAVIAVSEATRQDLLHFYQVDPGKAVTILSGSAPMDLHPEPVAGLPPRYALFVSTIEPRKNVDVLLRAFEICCTQNTYEGHLVLVGKVGWKSEATMARIARSEWRDRIVHLDYLRQEQLATVYANAEIFVMPSLYEGFGFPLLEAMRAGIPSIAARSSSLPEIGGDAALYFDPHNPGELAQLIGLLSTDQTLRKELARRGEAQALKFDWKVAAEATAGLFKKVAGRE